MEQIRQRVIIETNDPRLRGWNGERAEIIDVYTMHDGRPAAILAMNRIACTVTFPLSDLKKDLQDGY